jgi:DNA polymerase family A
MIRDVFIDHESYWDEDISIRNMCMKAYMSRSYSYLVSVVSGPYKWAGTPTELRRNDFARNLILDPKNNRWAVNSNFDQSWTEHESVLPESRGLEWQCVSDYSVSLQRPRDLERMYQALTGKLVSKGMRSSMKGIHPDMEFSFMAAGRKEYNLHDGVVAQENKYALDRLGGMSESERKIAAQTRLICRRGIPCDEAFIEKCRQALHWIKFEAQKQIPWAKLEPVLAPQSFHKWSCQQGVAPPSNLRKADADFTSWMEANPKLAPVLKARQRWELANRKLSHIEKFMARVVDGIYYPDLLYCGAPHTRRFSAKGSSDGKEDASDTHSAFNIQNMDKMPLFGDLLPDFFSPNPPLYPKNHTKAGQKMPGIFFRNFLVPPPGKVFGILDFSQIEPRCLNWLAGNDKFLDLIVQGYALYEAFARSVGMWNEPGKLSEGDIKYYTLIKNIVIGAGYGMSGKKFATYAKIPEEKAIEEITKFRKAAPMIPKFWYSVHDSIEQAYSCGEPLEIVMPNGETMRRFGIERYEREDVVTGKRRYAYRAAKVLGAQETIGDIYGAKVVENITQRMARDLLGEAVVRLEYDCNIPVLFHAHDEVIVLLDADNAAEELATAKKTMTMVPPWATGLPIQCSGTIESSYTKR